MFDHIPEEAIARLGLGMVAEEAKNLPILSEEYEKRSKEEASMDNNTEKTAEQLRAELIAQIKAQGGQFIDEIATPGVVRPVKADD